MDTGLLATKRLLRKRCGLQWRTQLVIYRYYGQFALVFFESVLCLPFERCFLTDIRIVRLNTVQNRKESFLLVLNIIIKIMLIEEISC